MKTKSIKQTITFKAQPLDVYNLIMDSKKHAAFTGSKVKMSKRIFGAFKVYDGYIRGYNIELIPGEKIVQGWNFAEEGWAHKHYSICTFRFEQAGNKTKLNFLQSGVPGHKVEELKKGWKQYYWNPMKAYLKRKYPPPVPKKKRKKAIEPISLIEFMRTNITIQLILLTVFCHLNV